MKISDAKLQNKINFHPHEKQKLILASMAEDIVINAGRRFGKSAVVAYIALKELLKDNKRIWIAAPTYDLSKRPFDYLVRWLGTGFPSSVGGISLRPVPRITMPWGSYVECKSAENPTGFLGEEVDLLIIEEAAKFKPDLYENYLFPVTSSRMARTIYISTPFGKNWFYKKHLDVKKDPNGEYFHFESNDSPYFKKVAWEKAKEKLSQDAFNQNYRALFLDDTATVFRGIRDIVGDCLGPYEQDHMYVVSADIAKHKDWTVINVVDRFNPKVRYWERFQKRDYPYIKERIVAAARNYRTRDIIVDSTGIGDAVSDWIKRDGFNVTDFKFSNTSKLQLVEKLRIFIENKSIIIPYNEVVLDEFESFTQEITASGNIRYTAPTGMYDDCVDSLGLAVWRLPTIGQVMNPITRADVEEKRKRRFQFK